MVISIADVFATVQSLLDVSVVLGGRLGSVLRWQYRVVLTNWGWLMVVLKSRVVLGYWNRVVLLRDSGILVDWSIRVGSQSRVGTIRIIGTSLWTYSCRILSGR